MKLATCSGVFNKEWRGEIPATLRADRRIPARKKSKKKKRMRLVIPVVYRTSFVLPDSWTFSFVWYVVAVDCRNCRYW
jgi:hypothetical protein